MTNLVDRKDLLQALTSMTNRLIFNSGYLGLGQNSIAQLMKELHELIDIVKKENIYSDGYVIIRVSELGLDHLLTTRDDF